MKKTSIAVEMREASKMFGSFVANDKINLQVRRGEILAILGENGAGKSTLMNMLYGLYSLTSGSILVDGEKVIFNSPADAIASGIGMVHQHFMLVKPFTVIQNIILGSETAKNYGILDYKKAKEKIVALSKKYKLNIEPDAKINQISVGMQQRVEILKALFREANTLILDEPTAVLTPQEIEELGKIMKSLTQEGKSVIFISHKLKEIKELADKCTVIRKGKVIQTVSVADTSIKEMARMMVGRPVLLNVNKGDKPKTNEELLKITKLCVRNQKKLLAVDHLDLTIRKGEILGLAGIDGNGQDELVKAITGLQPIESGQVEKEGKTITGFTPKEIYKSGIGHIPSDRQKHGLVLDFSVQNNMVLEIYNSKFFSHRFILQKGKIKSFAKRLIKCFDVRPTDENKLARDLSGGNQQKVILAREIDASPDLLIACQPTRGLDVGAIEYIQKSLLEHKKNGKTVFLVSLELDEVLALSDRIAVIHEGKIVGIVDAEDADRSQIGLMMSGGC